MHVICNISSYLLQCRKNQEMGSIKVHPHTINHAKNECDLYDKIEFDHNYHTVYNFLSRDSVMQNTRARERVNLESKEIYNYI